MEKSYITDNQVKIFHYPGEHLHSFCLSLYLNGGSIYETGENNGVSHFLEHVVIRNINHIMNGELYRYLDRLGLMFNACTYKEFVQFEITGAAKHFSKAVDVFVKIFEAITLPASEIGIERKRIKAEIREDDEKTTLGYFSSQIVWEGTSAAQMITGNSSDLDRMGKNVLQKAHEDIIAADNIFFYVTGKAGEEEIDYLKKAVEKYPLEKKGLNRDNHVDIPADFGKRGGRVAIKNSTDSVVRFSFDLNTNMFSQAAHMLLYDILFECENSKIHQALSEQSGFIYSFDSGMEQYRNIGNLYLQYEVRPSRLAESVEVVTGLLKDLKKGLEDELDYVKAAYTDNSEIILDHSSNLNWAQAYEGHILGRTPVELDERKQEYEDVTSDIVTELADCIFRTDNLVVTVKGKKTKKLEQQIKDIIAELD